MMGSAVVRTIEMTRGDGGWYSADCDDVQVGDDYGFLLDEDETLLPDPRSRRQPDGPRGPSRVWRDENPWNEGDWHGRDLEGAVLYELHVGTFSADGTLDSAIAHLDHLTRLGVTHVELLPLNDFNGPWNWGYDGVLWYAVHECYGGPDALHRFVEACHRRGLAVVLDVVYNHLGAAANFLPRFGPYVREGTSAWGALINLDGEGSAEVRRYILENASMWLGGFRLDGLRLDAVHALKDDSPTHLLAESKSFLYSSVARSP
jgi:maltooligosyltrehalose trehalohydrolase